MQNNRERSRRILEQLQTRQQNLSPSLMVRMRVSNASTGELLYDTVIVRSVAERALGEGGDIWKHLFGEECNPKPLHPILNISRRREIVPGFEVDIVWDKA